MRGALMISMDVNHPDVLEFIKVKRDLTKVTGANISIKLNDEFMRAIKREGEYVLRFPIDTDVTGYSDASKLNELVDHGNGVYTRRIRAKEYWDEIIKSAHNVAEPGLMFWDTMVDYSPDGVYPQFRQVTTNPCSEIAMQEYDACRLIAVNLFSFVDKPFTEEAKFNFDKFYKVNYEAMRLSDDLVDLELEHIDRIINKIKSDKEDEGTKKRELELWLNVKKVATSSRRTGLGFTALGDTLAALNIKYDSSESLGVREAISKTKMESELDCSIDMAITRGTFIGWDKNKEYTLQNTGIKTPKNSFYLMLLEEFSKQVDRMMAYGRRNISWSTCAPTGTVSLLTQTTSGIEPLFQPYYTRRKKVNKGERVDFTDDNGDTWQEFFVLHPKFEEWMYINDNLTGYSDAIEEKSWDKDWLKDCFEESPWFGSTANDIDWVNRVSSQAIIQRYISHSISSTINLPEDVTEEEVSEIYLESWRKGVKGITVYRDGSRSGVLISNDSPTKQSRFDYKDAVKRPKKLDAKVYTTVCKGTHYHVLVGLLDGKPYEVFMDNSDNRYGLEGTITKKSRGKYFFGDGTTNDEIDIMSYMTDEEEAITRLVSANLRHGTDIKFIVEQLNKTDGDMFSFTKGLARVLKKYIPDGAKSTVTCDECGSSNVVFEEGCNKCLDCGNSKCS